MKTASLFAVMLTLILAAPSARADVFVFQLPEQDTTYGQQPYPAQIAPAPPCACPPRQMQPMAYQQPVPNQVIARGDRTVFYGFNKSHLSNKAKDRLNTLAPQLMSADNVVGTRIIGYADRIGSDSYNETLSRKRADNVRNFLISHGFIKPSGIETRWVGKSQASTHCSKKLPRAQLLSCLAPDRKVEVIINYRARTATQPLY